jgi:N-acetylglucosaminyl-diphospho-decaprenol L-rhamnosyltransferase
VRTVDAIVPVYGHWPMVERCIAGLLAQRTAPHVIVVDDCSPDDVADRVAARFPEVELIRQPVNTGFAAACNAGFAAGSGDVVVLVNSDVEADPGLVEALLPAFDAEDVASASPVIVQPDGRLDAVGITADPTLAGFVRYHGASTEAVRRSGPRLLGPYGAVAAYRRSAMPGGTLFDEGIFMYGEELDLALRLSAAGHRSVVMPTALATHLGGATTGKGSSRQLYLAGYGRGYILGKYRVLRSRQAARALVTELIVVAQRLVRTGDPAALKGRIEGFLAGSRRPATTPPTVGLEHRIGFVESLRMRSARYWSRY